MRATKLSSLRVTFVQTSPSGQLGVASHITSYYRLEDEDDGLPSFAIDWKIDFQIQIEPREKAGGANSQARRRAEGKRVMK